MLSCPVHNFFWFDIGLPYLAHGSITKRGCVVYIHDPDWMLTFDLQVNFVGFCYVSMSKPVTSVSFDIGIPYLAHGSIPKRGCVKYIHDPDMTLTLRSNL